MNNVLVLFSGGKDSFYLTLLMLEKGYNVKLVTYENGCGLKSENAIETAKRIQEKYGDDKVEILGVFKTEAIWREFLNLFYNKKMSEILKEYGETTISQFNCLSCRLSMYVMSIILSNKMNIKLIVDGARKSQLFAIEQDSLLERFKKFFNYGEDKAAKLDFSKPVIVSQKVDGSLLSIWYDEDTGWHVSTSGNVDARDSELQFQTDKLHTYYDLFMEAFNKYNLSFDMFDKRYTTYYELVSPYNRVVVPYKETKLYWLGARDNQTLKEYNFKDIPKHLTDVPKYYECSSIEEIKTKVDNMSTKDEHFEGFVIEDCRGERIKLKSPSYMNLFFIKGDGIFSEKKILKIILEEEDDDILAYFPEYKPDFDRIRRLLSIYITDIKKALKEAENKLKLDRKEYAKWASKQINPYVLFKFYDNYDDFNLKKIIEDMPLEKLLDNVKKEKKNV